MAETNLQKFVRHCRTGGLFYAVYRGVKYISWRNECRKNRIDWKKFSRAR